MTASTGVKSYSTTAANNVQANTGINWDEGMSPAAVNNSARANMADTRSQWNDKEWFAYCTGDMFTAATYVSATSFKFSGIDLTAVYTVGRRVRAVGSSTGTIYGKISASAFSTDTTVTVIWDSGSLSNETLTVSVGSATTGKPVPVEGLSGTPVINNYISGLTLSTAGSSATMSIAAGLAADSTNAVMMNLASSISKTTSSWAVGTGNGGLDTGAIANSTWYHFYEIQRSDTGVVDVLFSLSASAPTMPSNYTYKRRIGSGLTNGSGQWVLFTQDGDEFLWSVPVLDITTTTLDTTAATGALTVPTGVKVRARIRARAANASAGVVVLINSPDEATAVADTPLGNGSITTQVTNNPVNATLDVRTNTSAQVRYVASASSTTLRSSTYGWFDSRGKL